MRGRAGRRAPAARVFHALFLVAPMPAGWSGGESPRGPAPGVEELAPCALPGPGGGQVKGEFPGGGSDPGRGVDDLPADRRGGRFRQRGAGDRGGGAGEVEGDHGEDEPSGVRGEHPGRQVREGAVLQVGVDLLDDRVTAVGLVRGDGVQGAGGEERVEPVRVEQGRLPSSAFLFSSGIRRTTRRPGTCSVFFREVNAVNGTSATSALEIHRPVVSSKIASVY